VRGIPSQGRLGEGTSRKSFSGIQGQSPVRGFVGQSSPKPKLSVSLLIVNSCVFIIVAFLKDGDIVHLQTFDSVAEITVFLQRHLLIFQSLRPVVQPRFVKGVPWREMASARSVSLYRGSGGTAPRGVQGQSPWSRDQGGKAFAPLKLKAFQLFYFYVPQKRQICFILCILQTQKISAAAAYIDNKRLFVYGLPWTLTQWKPVLFSFEK